MTIRDIEKRMAIMEDRVSEMDKNIGIFGAYLDAAKIVQEKFSETLEKFSVVVSELQNTLVGMQKDLTINHDDIVEVKSDINNIKVSVEKIDDKSKFDFIQIIKDNAPAFIIGGGLAYVLSIIMESFKH